MPAISKKKAVETLAHFAQTAHLDDLVEIYNELFPEEPTTEESAGHIPAAIRAKIQAHMDVGLEIEEILDLWKVIFPQQDLSFDDEKKKFYFEEAVQTE